MNKRVAYLGMDVHKNSITMALFIDQRTELTHIPDFRAFPHPSKLMSYGCRPAILECVSFWRIQECVESARITG